MLRPDPTRAIALFACCALLWLGVNEAQSQMVGVPRPPLQQPSSLPPSHPTSPPREPTPVPATHYAQVPATVAQRAAVTYSTGMLTVAANNSSLNQILRDISRQTGMKITGGVSDDRVFGTYGPAAPSTILATLLEGTGSNMLLVQSPGAQPEVPIELVLTPRQGGPTPPNPGASAQSDMDSQTDASPFGQPPAPSAIAPVPDQSVPANPPSSASPINSPATTQDQSPNGIKTPQQIYEQLMRLRQQAQPTPPR